MIFSNEIMNYQVSSPLPPEMIKTSREYKALAVLKYSFSERFAHLHKAEAPDLQDDKSNLGIEVTSALSPLNEQITGESIKYFHAKTEAERKECLRIINKCGGTRDAISTGFPVTTADSDKKHVIEAFKKKMKKIDQYHKRFRYMGLAIIIDIPMFLFDDPEWGKWLVGVNDSKYDFVALIHWSGVDIYDFHTGNYSSKRIGREDMDAIKKLARMAAEGIITDDNPVWQ
jgi:hypothetical protein